MSLIDQNTTDASDTGYEEGEWYLDDQDTLNMDTTLRDGEWHINDLEPSDVTDASNDGGEWYLGEVKDLTYLSACESDSTCTGTCSDTYTEASPSDNNEVKKYQALWTAMAGFPSS